jgi:deoxyribodipyrimidine photo-lyase
LVFSPFYKALKVRFTSGHIREFTVGASSLLPMEPTPVPPMDCLGFTPSAYTLESPKELLARFTPKLANYKEQRDRLDIEGTSRLDVALRFGTISVREILRWLAARKKEGIDTEPFFRQLVFRDFYAHMLYHFPYLGHKNYRYTWGGIGDETKHRAFCEARTGFPVVDAAVRELLHTGGMHNRARMICASFYTKDLLLPWQWGERFFAAHLNDYDAASNILSWQWSAGTGIDPQPYFRIFNPWRQSLKFDPDALYIKRWCPELNRIEPRQLHSETWMAEHALQGYPQPIIRHQEAAAAALAYFKSTSK